MKILETGVNVVCLPDLFRRDLDLVLACREFQALNCVRTEIDLVLDQDLMPELVATQRLVLCTSSGNLCLLAISAPGRTSSGHLSKLRNIAG
jgi:hypothetical protein